ncbi:MAG: homoserine dehydrogenase [Verrucomicrobiales bacterium]
MELMRLGLAGFGTVGKSVYTHLRRNERLLQQRLGISPTISKIAVRDLSKDRGINIPPELLTNQWETLPTNPDIDLVIELMGGMDQARSLVEKTLRAGKPVITANKALLAEQGAELFALAEQQEQPIFFEAAAAGGIPIIKTVREALVGNHLLSMYGIINGTSNYILSRMAEEGLSFEAVLADAQALGYAEADPTLDINGWDAAHKAILLATLAYGFWVSHREIYVDGIQGITASDVQFAALLGYTIKLLAVIKSDCGGAVEVRVHPTLIPDGHVLASVSGVFNAVAVQGDVLGESLFYGRGAGGDATSSAVLSDVGDAVNFLRCGHAPRWFRSEGLYGSLKPIGEVRSAFYLRLEVEDKPGVLAQVAQILGSMSIGISSVIQPELPGSPALPLVLMLHDAKFSALQEAIQQMSLLDCVRGEPKFLWVEHLPVNS